MLLILFGLSLSLGPWEFASNMPTRYQSQLITMLGLVRAVQQSIIGETPE